MSFLTSLFRKKKDEDYETVLSNLAVDIQKRQVQLSDIRLRERRSTLLVTLYTLAGWMAYVSLWYMGVLPGANRRHRNGVEKAVKGLPVVVGPVVILFIRRIVQIWYKRKGDAEEKTLQVLLKQQRTTVEEIKKKTNYYSTRELLQKYDESATTTTSSPILRQRLGPASTQPSTPQRPTQLPNGNTGLKTPNLFNPQSPPSVSTAPPRKQWYDKLADALLGDDDHAPNPSTARYALICEKCFAHNGLVKESMWDTAQYVCPKCNHFNPSANSRKLVKTPVAATSSPSSPSLQPSSPKPVLPSSLPQAIVVPKEQPSLSLRNKSPDTDEPPAAAPQNMMEVDDS